MRIHTNELYSGDFMNLAEHIEEIQIVALDQGFGSRSHDRAYEIRLTGSSKSAPRNMPGCKAATYREWGRFLALVFKFDPGAKCGTYNGVSDFDAKTGGEFPRR